MTTQDVLLAVYDGLADWEIGYVTAGLNNPAFHKQPGGYRVRTVAETVDAVTTMGGLRITPELTLDQADVAGAALLLLPGADSWLEGRNSGFVNAASARLANGSAVAAICGATVGMAGAGLLNDRAHTGNATEQLSIATAYTGHEHFRTARVVVDQGLVTAGAASPLEFAREIFRLLDVYEPAVLKAWYQLYATGDPEWFGKLIAAADA